VRASWRLRNKKDYRPRKHELNVKLKRSTFILLKRRVLQDHVIMVFKYTQPSLKGCIYLYYKPTTNYSREMLNSRENLPGNLLP